MGAQGALRNPWLLKQHLGRHAFDKHLDHEIGKRIGTGTLRELNPLAMALSANWRTETETETRNKTENNHQHKHMAQSLHIPLQPPNLKPQSAEAIQQEWLQEFEAKTLEYYPPKGDKW